MNDEETFSWIFLAIATTAEQEAVNMGTISLVADGINHAVPTQKEIQRSISWLISEGLIEKANKKYKLSKLGKDEYFAASNNCNKMFGIWRNLEFNFKNRLLLIN